MLKLFMKQFISLIMMIVLFSFEKNFIFKEKYMYVVKQNQHGNTYDKNIFTTIKSYNIYFTLSSVQIYDNFHLLHIPLFT